MKLTNIHNVPLALGVWLVADNYDYQDRENYVSVTSLMRPIRQLVLSSRTARGNLEADLADFASRAMGNALHDSIEKAWINNHRKSMEILGYPQQVIDRILINPSPDLLSRTKDAIPIYLEQRAFKKVGKWTVGGKFDMVADGIVHDNKSTTAYTWLTGDKDKDYQLQGSLYRWLNPDKITEDFIRINFIFTDWSKANARTDPKYPQAKVQAKEVPLLSLEETQAWVENKLAQIEKYWDAPDAQIPECSDEDLWRAPPKFKYYANASKTDGRSTKNFDDQAEANRFWKVEKGGAGVVIPVVGEPKRCNYCDAVGHCQQARKYFP